MPLRASDLPPDARRRVEALAGRAAVEEREKPRRPRQPVKLRCHTCDVVFDKTTGQNGYEQHARETGHLRFENVLHTVR